jgi:mRNA interferase MazF
MMKIKQYDIWIADLSPRSGTESGKTRPVVIVQSDLLNAAEHPSTIICPLTSKLQSEVELLRVYLEQGDGNMNLKSGVMVDQVRAIDNSRLIRRVGRLPEDLIVRLKGNLIIVLDLDLTHQKSMVKTLLEERKSERSKDQ